MLGLPRDVGSKVMNMIRVEERCRAFRCYRNAKPNPPEREGMQPLCGPHLAGEKRRLANRIKQDQQMQEARKRWDKDNAMRQFASDWRQAHKDQAYTSGWQCALCNMTVQSTLAEAGEDNWYVTREAIKAHQETHGEAWQQYWKAGDE